jgi:hypothetical protein
MTFLSCGLPKPRVPRVQWLDRTMMCLARPGATMPFNPISTPQGHGNGCAIAPSSGDEERG